jgi:hypothetical protein
MVHAVRGTNRVRSVNEYIITCSLVTLDSPIIATHWSVKQRLWSDIFGKFLRVHLRNVVWDTLS